MTGLVLAVNAGSGTVAIQAYEVIRSGIGSEPLWSAAIVRHTDPQRLEVEGAGQRIESEIHGDGIVDAVRPAIDRLVDGPTAVATESQVLAVGHRIVHGGPHLHGPAVITSEVRDALERAASLAPLHNPPALALVDLLRTRLDRSVQVAVVDTGFHHSIPDAARVYGGPREWLDRGLRAYGFHGISHEDASQRAAELLDRPLAECQFITAHFGGGCSATAVRNGRSAATTMGFTPNEGMIMAARSGTVDPGLVTHLMRTDGLSPDDVDELLNRRSGLLGLTGGRTGDITEALARAAAGEPGFALAVEAYLHRARREIGGLRPTLDRLDALVLTGSALDGQPRLRAELCRGLSYLGLELDRAANEAAVGREATDIATDGSDARIILAPSNEERSIARAAIALAGPH